MIMVERKAVDRVKRILRTLVYQRISVSEWMRNSIDYLTSCDILFNEDIYLRIALEQLQAYMEMGFCYEDNRSCFDELMERLNTCRELQFPRMLFPSERISVNKAQIKRAIGRWRPLKRAAITGVQLVADIMNKVNRQQEGHYYYSEYGTQVMSVDDCRIELFIGAKESYLYNKEKERYYTFKIRQGQG